MLLAEQKLINNFWVIGINYRKSDTALRGRYAVNNEQYARILQSAPDLGITELFILSTCNRTEIYGFSKDPVLLTTLLCNVTVGHQQDFTRYAYQKNSKDALAHLFNVAGGLDSQILGDYEIIGQIKQAIAFAKDYGRIGAFTDRLFKTVLQSSRAIRSQTRLSCGTVSVAFAAVQHIKNETKNNLTGKKILVIGSGKIGRNACKNLIQYSDPGMITLMNRTTEKAITTARELGMKTAPFESLPEQLAASDIIIVATNASSPLLSTRHFNPNDRKILIDLSIPNNIDPEVTHIPGITLANVDDLSKINDETLRRRQQEVPKAKALITYHIHQFAEWYMMQQNVPVIKAVKEKLTELNRQLAEANSCNDEAALQRVINTMALKMRTEERRPGCNYIEALSGFLTGARS